MTRAGNRNLSAAWERVRTRFAAMPRGTRWLNFGLLLLLVVATVATVLVITSPGGEAPAVRTATVTRGDVTALITGVGSTANLSVTTGSATGVLKAPTQAITTTGNRSTVTVRRDGVDTVAPVRIRVSGPAETEIVSGVSEGDVLVLPTPNVVTGGSGAGFPRSGGGR